MKIKRFKSIDSIESLNVGDVVRAKITRQPFIVTHILGDRATAVRSMDLTHPQEWERLENED